MKGSFQCHDNRRTWRGERGGKSRSEERPRISPSGLILVIQFYSVPDHLAPDAMEEC